MNNKKTYIFLLMTFIWSWTFWLIGLNHLEDGINQESIGTFLTLFFTGVYGPTISGILTTLIFDGFQGVLSLLKKLFIWNIPFKNYLYIILLPIFFVIIGIGLYNIFIGDIGSFDIMAFLSIPAILWAGFYAGPLGEELGWRGFLLPELQKKYSNLKSAILIGVIWFIWHIPLWWAPFGTLVSGESISFLPVTTYFLMLICLSIIITWLVINSKGSVLVAILFHLSINAGIALLFFPELNMDFKKVHLLSSIGMLMFIGILIAKNKLKTTANNVYS
ncbi:CPBP family intramembrane glutamic endopeptidase [Psychroserpens sp. SPM9]|uniref:CPBP family intramembrane glutamic endopeptidase n=1 Tax=Psychroserpens sp. SPM9 TaxID=2975598 RepID=UPI0021A33241|nr:type II CAAX endopeptidase family protein [Psychroserpens sp. SPM9]MDG5493217.1 type II CAAX endopeptidase family protein [Psychroserpens sp. SPM9]